VKLYLPTEEELKSEIIKEREVAMTVFTSIAQQESGSVSTVNLYRKISQKIRFRKYFDSNKSLNKFDKAVLNSIVERIILGGVNDQGQYDPCK